MTDKTQVTSLLNQDEYVIGAIMKLYSFQTMDERAAHSTNYQNGMGFNSVDAGIMTSFAKQYQMKGWLSEKQISYARPKLLKYKRQLEAGGIDPLPNGAKNQKDIIKSAKRDGEQCIKVVFPYDRDVVSKVKSLTAEGKRWYADEKCWRVSLCPENYNKLKEWGFVLDNQLETWHKETFPNGSQIQIDFDQLGLSELYPFQQEGVKFLATKKGRAVLGDEMGLGKTVQAIGWLVYNKNSLDKPALVVVPAAVKYNWKKEIEKWMHVTPFVISGNCDENMNTSELQSYLHDKCSSGIFIINYDILKSWKRVFLQMKIDTVILDECHYIKNDKALRTKATKEVGLSAPHVIALSGTPIINRPVEFYSTISLVNSRLFPSRWKYLQRYCGAKHNGWGWDFTGASNTDELYTIISQSIMLRRKKIDVLKDLPIKQRSVIPLEITNRKEYEFAEDEFLTWLAEKGGDVESAKQAETLVRIEKLKQLAFNGKANQVKEWIENYLDSTGEKLVVFCTHKKVIDYLEKQFKNISVKIDGSTSSVKRAEIVERFQTSKNVTLFLGNIKAAGVGITLTAASSVAFVELGWTPGEHDQAEDRIHRIGQEAESINAYYLIAEDTIENYISQLIDKKRKVLDQVLDGKFTIDEHSMLSELLTMYRTRGEKSETH